MATFTPAGETEPIDVWLPEIYRGLYAYEDVVFSLNDETGAWGGMIGGDTLTPPPVPPSPDGPPYGVWVDPVLGPVTVS